MMNLSFMKTKINKALFLSIFLMVPVPIFTSEIEELNNKRNSPYHLTNLSDNTTLKLNPKKDKTELIRYPINKDSDVLVI